MLLCFWRWFLWHDGKHNTATHFLRRMYFYHGVQCSVYWTNFQRWEQQEACSKKKDGNTQRESVFSICVWGGRALKGQGSQMKQIKGELWPSGEALAGYRDEIQMEDHRWAIHGVSGFISVLFTSILIALFKVAILSAAYVVYIPCLRQSCGACRHACVSFLIQPACLPPVLRVVPAFFVIFIYPFHIGFWCWPSLMWC